MGGLPPRRSDEEKLVRSAESTVEGEAHRIEASPAGARARLRAYVEDIFDETRPEDDDLRAVLDALDTVEAKLAQIAEYAREREAYGRRGRTVHSARIASDLLSILNGATHD